MTNYSKATIACIDRIISSDAKYDADSQSYHLDIDDILESDLEELSACLLADDEGFANEAVGADNPQFSAKMLPTLIDFLKNPANKDNYFEFMSAWRRGISAYSHHMIQDLLAWRLQVYYFHGEGAA